MKLIWEVVLRLRSTSTLSTSASQMDESQADYARQLNADWNPTGNIFDLRPEFARMPVPFLARGVLDMRQQLSLTTDNAERVLLSRFERQYSNALWQRVTAEIIETVTIDNTAYRIVLTAGADVFLLRQPPGEE